MSDVQRWEVDGFVDGWSVDPEGEWVKYDDHVAAVAAAEQDARRDGYSQAMHDAFGDLSIEEYQRQIAQRNFDMGVTFALGAARDAVLAVAMIGRGAASPPSGWVPTTDALAAIDALEKP